MNMVKIGMRWINMDAVNAVGVDPCRAFDDGLILNVRFRDDVGTQCNASPTLQLHGAEAEKFMMWMDTISIDIDSVIRQKTTHWHRPATIYTYCGIKIMSDPTKLADPEPTYYAWTADEKEATCPDCRAVSKH